MLVWSRKNKAGDKVKPIKNHEKVFVSIELQARFDEKNNINIEIIKI